MHLKILLPSRLFAEVDPVSSIVAETRQGSFGILPRRLDCVAALIPGIFTYRSGSATVYLAVDEGVLVKTGAIVMVSVRRAVQGADLYALHDAVKREFSAFDQQAHQVRTALAKLDGGLIARFAAFRHAG